jgi:uncharacterized protein
MWSNDGDADFVGASFQSRGHAPRTKKRRIDILDCIMKLSLDKSSALYLIDGFTPYSVRVAKREYRHPLIVTPERIFEPWHAPAVAELVIADFDCLADLELEVVLLGTGETQIFPPPRLRAEFGRNGIGFEVMNTPAACRTYNILAGESRKVAAALIIDH